MTRIEDSALTRVYLSYAQGNAARAAEVATVLSKAGCDVRLEALDVRPGRDFLSIFDHATATSDAVVVLISHLYAATAGFSRNDWITCTLGRRTPVVPMVLDDVDAQYYLGPFELLHADSLTSDDIIRTIRQLSPPPNRSTNRIVGILAKRSLLSATQSDDATSSSGLRSPIWHVPIDSRTYFTGRSDLLNILYREAMTSRSAILTHGLTGRGGVGKSRLAAEYAHRHRQDYDLVWWVRSSAQSTMNEDLARLGEELGVWAPNRNRWQDAGIKVREWLETTKSRWLLVFDDVVEPDIVQRALPSKGHGHVLITTRNSSDVPFNARPVFVDVLPVDAAVEFLLSRTGATDDSGAKKVARQLGYLALALEQASAYIAATGIGFGDYLRQFTLYRRRSLRQLLRQSRLRKLSTEQRITAGLAASCKLAIDAAAEADPRTKGLLESFSFLDTTPLELDLVRDLEPSLKISLRPLRLLSRYALIEFAANESTIVHPLVQQVIREHLSEQKEDEIKKHLLRWIVNNLPERSDDRRHWRVCGSLAPHAASLLEDKDSDEKSSAQLVLHRLGKYFYSRGDSRSAILYLQRAAAAMLRSATSPADASDVILNDLAVLCAEEGDWAQAVEVGIQIIQRRIGAVSATTIDASLVTFASNVAAALADSGRLDDADDMFRRLHDGLKIASSLDPEVSSALVAARHNWATVLDELGRFAEAESVYREVLSCKHVEYGSTHPETLVTLLGLTQILRKRGDFAGAMALAESAFKNAERSLGEYHAITLSALDLLAALSDDIRDPGASFVFAERAYARRSDAVGTHHPSTMEALHNLASIARRTGDVNQAQNLLERLVKALESTLGPQHPRTVGVVQELAMLRQEGNYRTMNRTRSLVEAMRPEDNEAFSVTRRRLFLDQVEVLD
ncbi:FxSxx-COOH system tetratricopeptide repeat protein [Micromonospora sp. WMMD723]|uniref:FxSxx-COOH system tetratricopeptide repeat protein n=1 Tax=unclassified Micromonospora TaxID=2617518 RepID=UPI0011985AD9|nr:FxSxx-COOH system tetratricopeptide repeat protein [Micromonospora sp. HM134]QDY06796.1 tetratricopeptide repeat protein [Micromonospora sp. HM134]